MDASSSSSSSSSKQQQQKSMANGFGYNSLLLLSSPFIHTPFLPQFFTQSSHSKPNLQFNVNIVRHLHSSIVSTAENCLTFLDTFASPNPLLDKIFLFFSSHFHNFSQIRRRNYRNLNSMANHNFAAIIPGDSVAGIVVTNGILNFLNIYNTLLVVRLVLTWFPNSPPAIVSPLSTLCDPYLNIFRGINEIVGFR
ncbi:ylmG homolog protein 2, chloroplastic-like isoform X1 [Cornus florida]|uniref:ylmG homolog protein 2, chloroplastic-like isoform X1 n=1 Tax=Cornus florida TaxID=4283 RepID=UPI00289D193F|nr:ylmG homolog protein 2, chloroplastic-like isoform X1 [Cornus florida]